MLSTASRPTLLLLRRTTHAFLSTAPPRDTTVLVDASGLVYRAYYATPRSLRRTKDGQPTNAVFGFTRMLLRVLSAARSDPRVHSLGIVFDSGKPSFRKLIFPDYKATRPKTPGDLGSQFSLVKDATRALGLKVIVQKDVVGDQVVEADVCWFTVSDRIGATFLITCELIWRIVALGDFTSILISAGCLVCDVRCVFRVSNKYSILFTLLNTLRACWNIDTLCFASVSFWPGVRVCAW